MKRLPPLVLCLLAILATSALAQDLPYVSLEVGPGEFASLDDEAIYQVLAHPGAFVSGGPGIDHITGGDGVLAFADSPFVTDPAGPDNGVITLTLSGTFGVCQDTGPWGTCTVLGSGPAGIVMWGGSRAPASIQTVYLGDGVQAEFPFQPTNSGAPTDPGVVSIYGFDQDDIVIGAFYASVTDLYRELTPLPSPGLEVRPPRCALPMGPGLVIFEDTSCGELHPSNFSTRPLFPLFPRRGGGKGYLFTN